jgi:hypothetical protein
LRLHLESTVPHPSALFAEGWVDQIPRPRFSILRFIHKRTRAGLSNLPSSVFDPTTTEGAPSFRVLCGRVGGSDLPSSVFDPPVHPQTNEGGHIQSPVLSIRPNRHRGCHIIPRSLRKGGRIKSPVLGVQPCASNHGRTKLPPSCPNISSAIKTPRTSIF